MYNACTSNASGRLKVRILVIIIIIIFRVSLKLKLAFCQISIFQILLYLIICELTTASDDLSVFMIDCLVFTITD